MKQVFRKVPSSSSSSRRKKLPSNKKNERGSRNLLPVAFFVLVLIVCSLELLRGGPNLSVSSAPESLSSQRTDDNIRIHPSSKVNEMRRTNNDNEQVPSSFECMEVGNTNKRSRPMPSENNDECLLFEPPSGYLRLLMDVLVGLPNAGRCNWSNPGCQPPHSPYDENLRRFGDDWPPFGFTMVGKERLANFYSAINEVNRNKIPGAICEFGVWRGGAMILAAAIMQEHDSLSSMSRELYLFDAFGSISGYGKDEDFLAVSLERVKENFGIMGINPEKEDIHFVKGMFQDTAGPWKEEHMNEPIAVLRVDGNFYESYQAVMYAMYENVPVGGIVIFDDVFHPHYKSVLQFWKEFKQDHGLGEELVQIDGGSGWFRKKISVSIDQSKKRQAPK